MGIDDGLKSFLKNAKFWKILFFLTPLPPNYPQTSFRFLIKLDILVKIFGLFLQKLENFNHLENGCFGHKAIVSSEKRFDGRSVTCWMNDATTTTILINRNEGTGAIKVAVKRL